MTWTQYTNPRRRTIHRRPALISLHKAGWGFAGTFFDHYELRPSKSVDIFYDEKRMTVAFRFYNQREGGSYSLVPNSRGARAVVPNFAKNLLGTDVVGRFLPSKRRDKKLGTLYVIKLKEPYQ